MGIDVSICHVMGRDCFIVLAYAHFPLGVGVSRSLVHLPAQV